MEKIKINTDIEIIDMENKIPTTIKIEDIEYKKTGTFGEKCKKIKQQFEEADKIKLYGKNYPSYFTSVMKWIKKTDKTVFTADEILKNFTKINTSQLNNLISYMIQEKLIYQINNFSFHICNDFIEKYEKIYGESGKK